MKKNLNAFTLAEVLITLTIIGVVAALTIPTLINNYQKNQYVTQLKKAYTTASQALSQMAVDLGCPGNLACTGVFYKSAPDSDPTQMGEAIVKYFKVAKNCGINENQKCFSDSISDNYTGTPVDERSSMDGSDYYKFITVDGASYSIYAMNPYNNCSSNNSRTTTGPMSKICAIMYVDVNGPDKAPNNNGRDIFTFFITNQSGSFLYPAGGNDDVNVQWKDPSTGDEAHCTTDPSVDPEGEACTGRVMEEGWKMNY